MEQVIDLDRQFVLWINQMVGRYEWLDIIFELLVSDYLIPVLMALTLMWLWLSTKRLESRQSIFRATLIAIASVGFSNLIVLLMNDLYFRPRPFTELDLNILFYQPTDSSFPANPAVLSFALAYSIWQTRKTDGNLLFVLASLWSFSRVYAGVFYLSDVIGGAMLGITISYCLKVCVLWLEPLPSALIRVGKAFHLI